MKCDGCGTTTDNFYYISKLHGGLVMCTICHHLTVYFDFIVNDHNIMQLELKRLLAKVNANDLNQLGGYV